jgi:hypothetical protein
MIPPTDQRAMSERAKAAVTETPASHAVYVSQPAVVALSSPRPPKITKFIRKRRDHRLPSSGRAGRLAL